MLASRVPLGMSDKLQLVGAGDIKLSWLRRDKLKLIGHPKRRRRCALPAHSKLIGPLDGDHYYDSVAGGADVQRPGDDWQIFAHADVRPQTDWLVIDYR